MGKNEPKYIYIHLIGDIDQQVDIADLNDHIEQEFILPVKESKSTIDPRDFFNPQRNQYHSTAILKEMLNNVPVDASKVIGITHVDLFIPILTFVFGEAQLNGTVGIVSLTRLHQQFYGLPPNQALLQRRLIKEVKHELGHTFGLVHCTVPDCVMAAANNIASVDSKGLSLCPSCKDLVRSGR